ncbi:phenylacetate--CoA ligase family protein [Chloroflexota bacterium]
MSGFTDKFYLASPIWLQQLMVAAYGWWWYRRRYSGDFSALYQEFQQRDGWTAEQFKAYQGKKLGLLLEKAWESPYYRKVFQEAAIQKDMPPFKALALLPYLSKELLRTHPQELLTQTPPPKGSLVFNSSGTTGTPTEIYYPPSFHTLELAVPAARNFDWAGIDYRARRVMFGVRKVCRFDQPRPPFWRFSPVEDMAYASIYHLSPHFLPHYIQFLRDYQPAVIMGYPSALRTIAHYAHINQDLPAPAQGIFTTSETVTTQDRQLFEEVWGCKVHDRYGAVENCLFAAQCEFGRYHVSPDMGIIEIVDPEGNPVPPGEMGEVICTGLHNLLQPLIRYRIGDVAHWAVDQTCECGRQMPILEAVEGRIEDICYTPDGRQMLRFDTVFKGVENLKEAQVVQQRLYHFVIRVVPDISFGGKDAAKLRDNMALHVGGDINVEIQPVDKIPRTTSGKFRAVLCNLSKEEKDMIRQKSNAH